MGGTPRALCVPGWVLGGLERDPCKGCRHAFKCVCVRADVYWGFHTTLFARTRAEVVPAGWGTDGGDLGEGAAMHCRSPPFAAMGMYVYACVFWGGRMTTPKTEPLIRFLCLGLPSALRKVWIGF